MEALSQYLAQTGTTQAGFADLIRVSQATVSRYLSGSVPSARVLSRIYAATGGAVRPDHFFPGTASAASAETPCANESPAQGQAAEVTSRTPAATQSPA